MHSAKNINIYSQEKSKPRLCQDQDYFLSSGHLNTKIMILRTTSL